MKRKSQIRAAVDIGGTFTDLVAMDAESGCIQVAKSDTTPDDFTAGAMDVLGKSAFPVRDISYFIHGSTIVINTLTERKGAKTGLVTTRGFRDVLEIGRANRPDLYNMYYRKPPPFVPRCWRTEVEERIGPDGRIITALNEAELAGIAALFHSEGIEAVAVCFLHSYTNPVHEQLCGGVLRSHLPDVPVTLSSDITKEWREFERTSTAVLNSYVLRTNAEYLKTMETRLTEAGLHCGCYVMQSNGGIATFERGRQAPINMVESGPVGGVIGAAAVGQVLNEDNIISFDVGGTTAKTSLVFGGRPAITTEYRIERTALSPGYPILTPTVDIVEIGAGGGSIAWVDRAGSLKLGPRSAGAVPGPASYGRGGREPTVTDANVLAGRINPEYFLGGEITLDTACALQAFQEICKTFRIDSDEAALGVIRLADTSMVNALKLVSVRRGYDPREFVLVACGGGGAMHAGALVRELQLKKAVVPIHPGLFSALGMLMTDVRTDFIRTDIFRLDDVDGSTISAGYQSLEEEAAETLEKQKIGSAKIHFYRYGDMRYYGQEHTVKVPVPGGAFDEEALRQILDRFADLHERAYSFVLDAPVELVNMHLTAFGEVQKPSFMSVDGRGLSFEKAVKGTRDVHYDDLGIHATRVFERDCLPLGEAARGPAIIEEPASTTVVYPDQQVTRDDFGFLHIERSSV